MREEPGAVPEPSRGVHNGVKIRLRRIGRKKQPTYRIVVADSQSPRDGKFIEIVGQYAPRQGEQALNLKTSASTTGSTSARSPPTPSARCSARPACSRARHETRLGAKLHGAAVPLGETSGEDADGVAHDDDGPARADHRRAGPQGTRHPRRARRRADHRRAGRGLRVRPSCFAGTATGDPRQGSPRAAHRRIDARSRAASSCTSTEIADRNAAELWRDRFLLVPADELDAARPTTRSTCTNCSACASSSSRASWSATSPTPTSCRRG